MNTYDLQDITSYDSRGNNRSNHLHCCSISLIASELLWKNPKLIRFSIDGPWAQLEVCTSCSPVGWAFVLIQHSPYFPSKKIYVFVRECGVSVNRATCTTFWVFETNKPHYLHRRNHEFEEQRILLLFLYQYVSWCRDIRHRSSQILRVTPFAIR